MFVNFILLKLGMLQLQCGVSCVNLCDTDVDNDCVLYNHGTRPVGKSVNWRTYTAPNRIDKIEEKGMCVYLELSWFILRIHFFIVVAIHRWTFWSL